MLGHLFVSTIPNLSFREINNLDSVIHDVKASKRPLDGARVIYCHLVALDGAIAPLNASSGFCSYLV